MEDRILFDLEGLIKEKLKPRTMLGVEQTGQRVRTPASALPLPPAEPRVEPEATPRTQQTAQTSGQAQTTPPEQNDQRVDGSPVKNTRNYQRFVAV